MRTVHEIREELDRARQEEKRAQDRGDYRAVEYWSGKRSGLYFALEESEEHHRSVPHHDQYTDW